MPNRDSDAISAKDVNPSEPPVVKIEMEDDFASNNSNIEEIYVPGKPLNTPMTFAEMQSDLSQELDLIKHEVDVDVKMEDQDISNTEKSFACTFCDSSFTMKTNLIRHIQTHTGEKSYLCTVCKRSFIQKHHLVVHMRTHTGEKPYSCTVCNSAFKVKHTLTRHMRIHTGEKPYLCTVCNRTFKIKDGLYRHLCTHTGDKP